MDENHIRELMRAAQELERIQRNCSHPSWENAVYDPEPTIRFEPIPGEYEKHGSDIWPKSKLVETTKPRWSKRCKACQVKRYFYTRPE